ncbi:hypothetical protein [Pseudonocardia sp. MH-G8]|uniref:hypothetical protein n=1 Tax=Pseudonocardia sp. MH-G8 TaxID=1854588 RepID=UPI000BA043EF|nr:hypothetical protein [Pseudonocardia sp. MH-G8]OZM81349.1 hypothetical protein CFP66_14370 [Pseudonocardia sp. MH-G8]
MHSFPRPRETHLHVERRALPGPCPACGAPELAAYRVLGEGGWWDVEKCRSCLHSVRRVPVPVLGAFRPLGSGS